MKKPLITLTSDFGIQTQGCGIMKAVALEINPTANVLHLMHGLPDYDITYAARTMETVSTIQVGYHVCVVDPGVGTSRKPIIIRTKRGDYLIGPDNGVLIPATRILGFDKAHEISNPKYMRQPVSAIFHGRDIFTPAAAYLSTGIPIEEFGKELKLNELVRPPYEEAVISGGVIDAQVISINKFGSIHLNILSKLWDKFAASGQIMLESRNKKIRLPIGLTFGDVPKGEALIMKDDYGRIEVAVNQGSFVEKYNVKVGDKCVIKK